ncbi:leucine--tRNA ligase [Patescibacteria group bacterium]
MAKTYNHKTIEKKWKSKWFGNNIYEGIDFSDKPKKYILAELPYPSGDYLHVGHMMRYTVPEIYSRFLRMQGYNVLFPMGWDSFGLPAETNAIKTNRTPQQVIKEATPNFRKSMQDMGYAIDWNREINTAEPEFYKWTQWAFIKMWEKGLVTQKEMPVWWCKELGVLADEEVLPDPSSPTGKKSERDGYPVYRKTLKQWVLKITEYADKLLDGLDEVDYTESVKESQRNWVGKKEGVNISYPVEDTDEEICCFTTRPDTNFGATFIVLAPEHPFVQKIEDEKVKKYVESAISKSELERLEEKGEKTGVFTGFYAVNRLTEKKMPIWVADFVLEGYGTGAVVGVPGHDKRDFEFATKFDLEIIRVVESEEDLPYEESGIAVNSEFLNGLETKDAIEKITQYLEEKGWGEKTTTYRMRDQIWSRQRYWGDPIPLIYKEDGTIEADYDLPVELPKLENFLPENGKAPLEKMSKWYTTKAKDGSPAKRETDTMPTWAGSNWYYLRYIDPGNDKEFADQEKLKYWLPVDKYFGDAGHTTAHLLYTRFWCRFLYDEGYLPVKEPIKWRMSGGILLGADNKKMSKSRPEFVVDPKDVIESYGADATRVYLAFIGPYEDTYPWNDNGIKACFRFVRNIFELSEKVKKDVEDIEVTKAYHKMLKKITSMNEKLKMNTAVAEFMKFINVIKTKDYIDEDIYMGFVKVVAPYAPFVAEEVWQKLNGFKRWKNENSVHLQSWPKFNEILAKDDILTIAIQVNGKVRGEIEAKTNEPEESIKEKSLADPNVKKYISDKTIEKFIYVPGKIANIVTSS